MINCMGCLPAGVCCRKGVYEGHRIGSLDLALDSHGFDYKQVTELGFTRIEEKRLVREEADVVPF